MRAGLCLTFALLFAEVAAAQAPAPLMYVRFNGPTGAKLTVYRGVEKGQTLDLPCTLGFRPGYAYRLAVSDIPGFPRTTFCPSLEVRGALVLGPKARTADFPAHVNFTEEEMQRVSLGAFVKKVITLERPDQAIPTATTPEQPLEIPVQGGRDPYVEAAERGAPLIVFHLGQRHLTPQELNAAAIPGTLLLPGERVLGAPKVAPYLNWHVCQVFDPVLGPRHPSEFRTIYDGGDSRSPAGFDRFGRLKGLDPSDTMAEYTDSKGYQKLAVSNRVGLSVPRFVIFKSEFTHATQATRINLNTALTAATPSATVGQVAIKAQARQEHVESMDTKMRLSGAFNTLGTSVMGRMLGVDVKRSLHVPKSVDVIAAGPKEAEPTDGPLMIIKWPDKTHVNVGAIVTFYLKYSNTGGQPITSVVVSDSLAARFEYVQGSTKTDRDALFTTQANEAGSTVLRWEFTGALQPREHGLILFQVRVR